MNLYFFKLFIYIESYFILSLILLNHGHHYLFSYQIQSKPIKNMETIEVNSQPVFRVVIDKWSGDVFVGARNAIYRFSSNDLQKLDQAIIGPVNDSIKCLPFPSQCQYPRQLVPNDNKVLLMYYDKHKKKPPLLLACGNASQGICYVIQTDKSKSMSTPARLGNNNETINFVSGRDSTVAYFAPAIDGTKDVLYVANSYDGRPIDYTSYQVSSRHVRVKGFELTSNKFPAFTQVDFTPHYKQNYPVKYLYGFSHNGFSYFITIQPISIITSTYETRLARVCQNDMQFFSYMEVPLECKGDNGITYSIATSAYFGEIGKAKLNSLGATEDDSHGLYITFGVYSSKTNINTTFGSALCGFSMETIRKNFTKEIKNCFKANHRSRLLDAFHGEKRSCTEFDNIDIDDSFCGSGFNRYIEGVDPIQGYHFLTIQGQVTSLAVGIQGKEAVAAVGTSEGKIMKYKIEKDYQSNAKPLFEMNLYLSDPPQDRAIRPEPAFDSKQENLYLLSGNQIIKFPFGSCSLHTDCSSCLGSIDPIGCGWCGSFCSKRSECDFSANNVTNFDQCPPEVFDFEPKSGPIPGGTLITFTGDNLGHAQSGQNSFIEITVAGQPCHIVEWQSRKVVCRTEPVEKELSGPVMMNVKDLVWSETRRYDIEGSWSSHEEFKYLDPQLMGIDPAYGPYAGGTQVRLIGRNLKIGSKRKIDIGGIRCEEINNNSSNVYCLTGKYNLTKQSLTDTSIKFYIDNVELIVNNNKINKIEPFDKEKNVIFEDVDKEYSEYFQYKPDPEVISFEPNATIASGNTSIYVYGKNLDSIAYPKMFVVFQSKILNEESRIYVDCESYVNGTEMKCQTPKLPTDLVHKPTSRVPILTYVSFKLDGIKGVDELYKSHPAMTKLIYYPDPKFYPFSEQTRTVYNEELNLEIEGENLSIDYDFKITISVNSFEKLICKPISIIGFEKIICEVPRDERFLTGDTYDVSVSVGHINFRLGNMMLQDKPATKTSGWAIALLTLVPFILIAAIGFVGFKILRKNNMTKKQPPFSVSYTNQQSIEDQSFQRQGSQNEYHGNCNQPLLGALAAAGRTQIFQVDDETMQLLRDQKILFEREDLELLYEIGQGHFGLVYKGLLKNNEKEAEREVAVKTINTALARTEIDVDAFMQEGLMMKDFMHHNVLTLIGVCFNNDGSPMVILPFMSHGDLLSFIRNENNQPTVKDLLTFGIQVAEGMEYLSSLKFVHRDLAARNCMLDDDSTVKVADFGLSRDVYEREYYSSDNKKTKLPVKWMSPESLEKGTYNTKTDVWSYGVLVWELLTRGVTPYPDVDNWDILNYLKRGRRMPCPSHCPPEIYLVLLKCWSENPKDRPTFGELVHEINDIIVCLEERSKQYKVSLDVNYVNLPVEPEYYNNIDAIRKEVEIQLQEQQQQQQQQSGRFNIPSRDGYETTC